MPRGHSGRPVLGGHGLFVGRVTLINREVLPWLWACRGLAMSSRRLSSGFSRDVSCRFSFFFCPSVGHVCGLGQEIPTVPVVPQLRLEGHQSVPAEPRPEIPAGPTGSRCLPLFFFSTLYSPLPCLAFGDRKPQVIESMRVI